MNALPLMTKFQAMRLRHLRDEGELAVPPLTKWELQRLQKFRSDAFGRSRSYKYDDQFCEKNLSNFICEALKLRKKFNVDIGFALAAYGNQLMRKSNSSKLLTKDK